MKLSLIVLYSLCTSISSNEVINKLNSYRNALKSEIENKTGIKVNDIIQECEQSEKETAKWNMIIKVISANVEEKKCIKQSNERLEKLIEQLEKSKEQLEQFVNIEVTSNYVPSCFICAWNLIIGTLYKLFNTEGTQSIPRKTILKEQYPVGNGHNQKESKSLLRKTQFIEILKNNQTLLNESFINNTALYAISEFKLHNQGHYYHDDVLRYFFTWKVYIQNPHTLIAKKLRNEIQNKKWNTNIDKFCLIMARSFVLGNSIKHKFWKDYNNELVKVNELNFDAYLKNYYNKGWYFDREHLENLNLFLNVAHPLLYKKDNKTEVSLTFEPLIDDPQNGVPLFFCPDSIRNLKYQYEKWRRSSNYSKPTTLKAP